MAAAAPIVRAVAATLLGVAIIGAERAGGRVGDRTEAPRRIVSLLPSLTESVWTLGGGERLVGVDRYSNWPPEIADLPRLGGLDDTDVETIVALAPDLVLASTSSARAVERLRALGLEVLALDTDTWDDMRASLAKIAEVLGRPDADEALVARLDAALAREAARVPPPLRGARVYFEVGSGPIVAGPDSFVGELLARLGLDNVVPEELGPFPRLNPELVLGARPDVIMGPAGTLRDLAARPGWDALAAIEDERVCTFDGAANDALVRPGPRLDEAARALVDCLVRLGRDALR